MSCLFCKIVNKEIPAKVVLENEHAIAFHDVNPVAPTHLLVIPKKHIASMHDVSPGDAALLGEVFMLARNAAESLALHEGGYRVAVNNGENAGQSVFHLHVHVLGGRQLTWPPG